MINVVDVTQHYGIRPVLRHINLSIPAGSHRPSPVILMAKKQAELQQV
jgi:hypothetical protein